MNGDKASKREEKAIVLYLFEFLRHQDDTEMPPGVTASTMSRTIGISQPRLIDALRKLKSIGKVNEWLAPIKGYPGKRQVFFLTKDGEKLAMFMSDELKVSRLVLRTDRGGTEELFLSAIKKRLGFAPRPVEVVASMGENSVVSIAKLKEVHAAWIDQEAAPDFVDFSSNAPRVPHLVGREKEKEAVRRFMASLDAQVLVVKGIDGIGKTSLIASIIGEYKRHMHVYWTRFREWTTMEMTLNEIARFLAKMKDGTLRNYLVSTKVPDVAESVRIMENALYDTKILFILDDLHMVSDKRVMALLSSLLDAIEGMMGAKVIVMGRTIPPFYSRTDLERKGLIMEMPLIGIDEKATIELLSEYKVDAAKAKDIFDITEGHPLYIELVRALGPPIKKMKVTRYIEEELPERLPAPERVILNILSCFRVPTTSVGIIRVVTDLAYKGEPMGERPGQDDMASLVDKCLIMTDADGYLYDMHDTLREYFYDNLSPRGRRDINISIASHFQKSQEDPARFEVLHHLAHGGLPMDVAVYAIQNKDRLILEGHLESMLTVLNDVDTGLLPGPMQVDVICLFGEIHMWTCDWESARRNFSLAVKLASTLKDDVRKAKALASMGKLSIVVTSLEEAEAYFRHALETVEMMGGQPDTSVLALVCSGLADVNAKKGDLQSALRYYYQALGHGKRKRNMDLVVYVIERITDIQMQLGKDDEALQFLVDNLRLIHVGGDEIGLERAHNIIGYIRSKKGQWAEAAKEFGEAVEISKRTGLLRALANDLMNLAWPYAHLGRQAEALQRIGEAQELYIRLRDPNKEALARLRAGEVLVLKGDWKEAETNLRKGVRLLEETKEEERDGCMLVLAYDIFGNILKVKGDEAGAEGYIEKAIDLKRAVTQKEGPCGRPDPSEGPLFNKPLDLESLL